MDLILASTSPYRRALLERLGIPFRCVSPRVDEDAWKGRGLAPRELAEALAEAKADSLRPHEPGATIIGSDQVAVVGDRVLSKPGTREAAVLQLSSMAGREHSLVTAMAVRHGDRLLRHTDVTVLRMRALGRDAIVRYVEADLPLDCAGSYKLESRGIALFEAIDTRDPTAITGLPLVALTTMLRDLGFRVP